MTTYKIENIPFSIPQDKLEIQTLFENMLNSSELNEINFANPEFLQIAMKNPLLKRHMEKSKYNFCDGIGLLMLINKEMKTNYGIESRFPGTDFFSYMPANKNINIFLFGASKENNDKACENIQELYKNIHVCGHIDGYTDKSDNEIIKEINTAAPDIIIVCLGCPMQETWIENNKDNLNAKIIFGNGGAIDFWSGAVKRAPVFFINHKLEWFYRLFQDFNWKRIKRQLKIIKFLWEMNIHKYNVNSSD